MIPAEFEYAAPTTLDEAVAALNDAGEDAKVLAGGQSLMPVLRLRMAAPTPWWTSDESLTCAVSVKTATRW